MLRRSPHMDRVLNQTEAKRRFLRMLVASPLFAGSHFFRSTLTNLLAANVIPEVEMLLQSDDAVSSPDQALDVMDFERAARQALPPAHFGYLATGVDDD